jgi:hypothetical protein
LDNERVVDPARAGADFPRESLAGHLVLKVSRPNCGLDLAGWLG